MLDWRVLAVVAAGAGVGGVLRYLVGFAFVQRFGPGFPWGTLFINLSGSFLIGVVVELSQTRAFSGSPYWRPFAATGLLGGYTTFSAFAYETLTLAGEGALLLSLGYAVGSVALGVLCAYLGIVAVRAAAPT
jgi:CrcB protein